MIEALWIILVVWAMAIITWALYICSMQLKYHKQDLYPVARFHAYILAAITIILDAMINIVASIPLLELPRWDLGEFLLSPRLRRLRDDGSNAWRTLVAEWLCEHMLNQFDRSGDHC